MSVLPNGELRRQLPSLLESPALYRPEADTPAFEVKFLLTETQAVEVETQLRPSLVCDPHADPASGNSYRVTSVYFDTPALDVFRRTKGHRRRKFRIRRYGTGSVVFLEQKSKSKQQVKKKRTVIADGELSVFDAAEMNGWPGAWFAAKLATRSLVPICRISYQRTAFIGTSSEGPIRVTFDRRAHGATAAGRIPEPVDDDGKSLLSDEVIVEFKFMGAMPNLFKSVIEGLQLTPRPVSKYRRCIGALGLVAEQGNGNA